MEEIIRKDILLMLKDAHRFLLKQKSEEMKKLSSLTINNASIFQDLDSVNLAVIVYAVAKLMERRTPEGFNDKLGSLIHSSKDYLFNKDFHNYNATIKEIGFLISTVDKKIELYIDQVLEKSRIKKGSKIHQQGISLARTAQMLGIGRWELMNYVGKTKIHDKFYVKSDVKNRLDFARSLFN
ncbi:hypothetical protein HN587_01295 [Candidatus Woesearchaeota archaeon]|jgi:hypothetical protein|nr:hypothetical protein [Candidatus Woesearchaeota archaeon]